MGVRASGDEIQPARQQRFRQGLRIGHDLRGVGFEFRLKRLPERDRLRGDHVHERASLDAGENRGVDLFCDVGIVRKNKASSRAAQGLVRCRRCDMGMRERGRMRPAGDQAGDMGDVGEKDRSGLVGDFAEPAEVDRPRHRRAARDYQLRLALQGEVPDLVVVDHAVLAPDAVPSGVEPLPRLVRRGTVSQMSAGGEAHAEQRVARPEQRVEHRLVGLAARVRLDVREPAAEESADALFRKILDDIHPLAPAVIPPRRIAFRVFVHEHRSLGLHHRPRDDVFGRDQFDSVALPPQFGIDRIEYGAVRVPQRPVRDGSI